MKVAANVDSQRAQTLEARWDAFLEQNTRGQFQQTSRWARVKALDGWNVRSVFCDPENPERGGCQLLWKQTRLGKIGYVSKGPVLPDENPRSVADGLRSLRRAAESLELRATIVQPPDRSAIGCGDLAAQGFCRRVVSDVIRATSMIDVSGGRAAIEQRLHRQARRHVRAARERGVMLRLGERRDLREFFELMLGSCRRQQTQPNPSRPELLEALWDAFRPHVCLGLARLEERDIAGLLMIGHGERLTLWKKGWSPEELASGANCLLHVEALGWASDHGYRWADFAGLDRDIAERLLAGGALRETQRRSRDVFNLSLGAEPRLLPGAQVFVPNRGLRALYELGGRLPGLERWLMRGVGAGG